jgi:predicted dehydrogenase
VIDICAPSDLHKSMVIRAAEAGKHVICEKPIALTLDDAQTMLGACAVHNVTLLIAHVVRFFPEYALAQQAVERGDIGRVGVIRLTRCSYQPKPSTGNWFLDPARSGGMMIDLMIHDFDYARWIAGEVESVYARSVRSRTPDAPGDYALVVLRHEGGAISNVEGGWAYPPPMFRTALEIAGDGGLIEHPAGSSQPLGVHLQARDGETPDVALPRSPLIDSPYDIEIRHFYDVLANSATPRVSARDGYRALEIALAARESAVTGKPVSLKEKR